MTPYGPSKVTRVPAGTSIRVVDASPRPHRDPEADAVAAETEKGWA
jgi:hypothetical protein